jgi:thioredoxin reductase
MTKGRTVDLVVSGGNACARAAALEALRSGGRVLMVLCSGDARRAQRLRRRIRGAPGADAGQLRIMAGAEVVCVDGLDGVEAVVVRHTRTGRLSAVNASGFVSFVRARNDGRRALRGPAARRMLH